MPDTFEGEEFFGEESQQSKQLQTYLDTHGVTVNLFNTYTLNAMTYAKDPTKVIFVQNNVCPTDYTLTSYIGYKEGKVQNDEALKKTIVPGFNINFALKMGDSFRRVNRRFFGEGYNTPPMFSDDHEFVAFLHKPKSQFLFPHFDIFTCGQEDFFLEKVPLAHSQKEYVCTLKISNKELQVLKQVKFADQSESSDERYICVELEKKIKIYNLLQKPLAVNSDTPQKNEISCEVEVEVKNPAYDQVLGVWVDASNLSDSWVALLSLELKTVHFVSLQTLQDVEENEAGNQNERNYLQGVLYQASQFEHVEVDISDNFSEAFAYQVKFQKNGERAIVIGPNKTLVVNFQLSEDSFYNEMQELNGKNVVVLSNGTQDLTFAEHKESMAQIQFTTIENNDEASKFLAKSMIYISCDKSQLLISEAKIIKVENPETKQLEEIFRVFVIRSHEEILCWDFKKSAEKRPLAIRMNTLFNYSFTWPYFAQVFGQKTIVVCPLFYENLFVIHDLIIPNDAKIHGIQFGADYKLFLIVEEVEEFSFYYIDVGSDIRFWGDNYNHSPNREEVLTNETWRRKKTTKNIEEVKGSIKVEIGRFNKATSDISSIYLWKVVENQFGPKSVTRFFMINNYEINVLECDSSGQDCRLLRIDTNVLQLFQSLDHQNFVALKEDKQTVKVIKATQEIQYNTLYQELVGKIEKILTSYTKTYMLIENQGDFTIKAFNFDAKAEIKQQVFVLTSKINLNRLTQTGVIVSFLNSKAIIDDCICQNKDSIIKLYSDKNQLRVQTFNNYLPQSLTQQEMVVQQSIPDEVNRRTALFFSRPQQSIAKQVVFMPYFTDNIVSLSSKTDQACWIYYKNPQSNLLTGLTQKVSRSQRTSIFSFSPSRLTLSEFSLDGIRTKVTNFSKDLSSYEIIAVEQTSPVYLVTKKGSQYLVELEILRISENHIIQRFAKINTKNIKCSSTYQPLFEELCYLKEEFKCAFEWQLNEELQIVLVAKLKNGYIGAMFLLHPNADNEYKFLPVKIGTQKQFDAAEVSTYEPPQIGESSEKKNKLSMRNIGQLAMKLEEQRQLTLIQKSSEFDYCSRFVVSNCKLIIWNSEGFYQANIDTLESQDDSVLAVELSKSQFGLQSRHMFCANPARISKTASEVLEQLKYEKIAFISEIYCRDKTMVFEGKQNVCITIKIVEDSETAFIIDYNLDREREVTSIIAKASAQLCFDKDKKAFVVDETGLIEAADKQNQFYYHLDHPKNSERIGVKEAAHGISWGSRFCQTLRGKYVVFGGNLILPYNYLSFVQHFQPAFEEKVEYFDMIDYYKIDGQTIFHKNKRNPQVLERIIDCYVLQNPNFILAVLMKEEIETFNETLGVNDEQEKLQTLVNAFAIKPKGGSKLVAAAENILSDQKKEKGQGKITIWKKVNAKELKLEITQGEDLLDTMLALSYDNIVNKILRLLSATSVEDSFYLMIPRFDQLVKYTICFQLYVDQWFFQTTQHKRIQVLFTDQEESVRQLEWNSKYLDINFFQKYPSVDVRNLGLNDKPAEGLLERFETFRMSQISVRALYTPWIHRLNEGEEKGHGDRFQEALVEEGDISYFRNPNIMAVIDFQWNYCKKYLLYGQFLPFTCLFYTPLVCAAVMPNALDKDGEPCMEWPELTCYSLMSLFLVFAGHQEIKQMQYEKLSYLKDPSNYLEATEFLLYFYILWHVYAFFNIQEDKVECLQDIRVLQIVLMMLQTVSFFNKLRIFDFFASFTRSMIEISKDSLPLASLLSFTVLAFTCVFYVLSRNNVNEFGEMENYDNFWLVLIKTYQFALGDFGFQDDFGSSTNPIVFWVIFTIATVMQILVLLNMVIAVMSAAFDRVESENEAYIYREKLVCIMQNRHLYPSDYRKRLTACKYLVLMSVDEQSTLQTETATAIEQNTTAFTMAQQMETMLNLLSQVSYNLEQRKA